MKTCTKILLTVFVLILTTPFANAQQQIPFQGMVNQGFGVAAWNADGTGPEPAATGHQVPFPGFGSQFYYGASRDYISGNPDHSCFAFMPGITGFPNFTQALTANGYTPGQVKAKFGLVTLGEDEEGLDWFVMDNYHHSSHKHSDFNILELNGEPMLAMKIDYGVWSVQNGTTVWLIDFGYLPVINISGSSSAGVQAVAQAFLADLDGKLIRMQCQSSSGGMTITGNGRNGAYYNIINGLLTVGNPSLPFKGLYADNQGVVGWNADGTGPEPPANGHMNYLYYGASIDYDGINPSPDACLGHFLEGSTGFSNTLLQLQYRGFAIGDLKMKLGLASFGPDMIGEDWGNENGNHWVNQYNNVVTVEINEEPILVMMADTNKMVLYSSHWKTGTSTGKIYDISENASSELQYVAKSFLRDLGAKYMKLLTSNLTYAGSFSGNGRDGAYYQINAGELQGVYENITFVPSGEVSGIWTSEGSPYYVDGHLEIADGETLIIEPGVKVAVRGPYAFNVQGTVFAEGTENSPILFTRSNPNLWWDGFDYYDTPVTNASSLFDHCIFEYGYGQGLLPGLNSGGAFVIKNFDSIFISNSTFRHNKVDKSGVYPPSGGAIGLWTSSPVIQKCIFHDNEAEYGGAIFAYSYAEPIISNCLIHNNTGKRGGAVTFYSFVNGMLINNTIVDNYASFFGGAFYLYGGSRPEVINNIIWNNESVNVGDQVYLSGAGNQAGFYYNNIQGGQEGFGSNWQTVTYLFNMDEDPLFTTDPELPAYSLQGESPSINAGTPDTSAWFYPQYLPETCLCGNPRLYGDCIDMGAYETLIVDLPQFTPIGSGISAYPNPFVDHVVMKMALAEIAEVKIQLFNTLGSMLWEYDYGMRSTGQHEIDIPAAHLPAGIYFLSAEMGGKVTTIKLVKTQ